MKKEEKQVILEMFFIQRKKQIEIAKILNISKFKVSRTVTKDSRYIKEKENRKKVNKEKHKLKTKQYMAKIRELKKVDDYAVLKKLHNQDSIELSDVRTGISNKDFRKWNASAYDYDKNLKCYVVRKDITAGADLPKKVKW